MLHALRYGVFARLWPYVSYVMVWLMGPRFAAYVSARTIDWGDGSQGPVVLCLFRESFVKDIHEMRQRTDMRFAMVMGGFTRFQEIWFPEGMRIQTLYQSYRGSGRDRALVFSKRYAKHLVAYVEKKEPVQAVLSANFDYWQEEGLKQVCKEKNIPFVVLSREHPVVPVVCHTVTDWYVQSKYIFNGDLIAVAGDSTRTVLARIGTVCREEQVVVTGLPRFDAWRDVDCTLPWEERKCITLLTFTEGYFADQGFVETLKVFLQAAEMHQNSGLRFLIKTKDARDQHLVRQMIPASQKMYVDCTAEEDLFRVLPQSRCVVGYNSLSLVEAVIAGSQLMIPAWGECLDRGPRVMYSVKDQVVSELVDFAYSPDAMLEMISCAVTGHPRRRSPSSIEAFVVRYVRIPQGTTASQEVVACIKTAMLKCSNNQAKSCEV